MVQVGQVRSEGSGQLGSDLGFGTGQVMSKGSGRAG